MRDGFAFSHFLVNGETEDFSVLYIMILYMQQKAVVRTENGNSELVEIGRDVKQGCFFLDLCINVDNRGHGS